MSKKIKCSGCNKKYSIKKHFAPLNSGLYICPRCGTTSHVKQPCTFEAAVQKIAKIIITQYKANFDYKQEDSKLSDKIIELISDACGEVQVGFDNHSDDGLLYDTMEEVMTSINNKPATRQKISKKPKTVFVHYHHPGSGCEVVCCYDDNDNTGDFKNTTEPKLVNCPECLKWLETSNLIVKPKRKYVRKPQPARKPKSRMSE